VVATTSVNRLAAACPHSAGNVEASDPDIIMRRSTTSERTMTPAMTSKKEVDTNLQLKGRLTEMRAVTEKLPPELVAKLPPRAG
jgi:hypothetical protein